MIKFMQFSRRTKIFLIVFCVPMAMIGIAVFTFLEANMSVEYKLFFKNLAIMLFFTFIFYSLLKDKSSSKPEIIFKPSKIKRKKISKNPLSNQIFQNPDPLIDRIKHKK